jgi:hypothetical protein
MRVADFVKAVVKAVRKPDHAPDSADGWIRTIHIIPLLGLKSLAGARGPIARIVKAGFAEEHRVRHNLFTYRLSPKF